MRSPSAGDFFQTGHRSTERCKSTGAFPLDEGLQSFPKQCGLFRHSGELLGGAYEIVIQRYGSSHSINYSIKRCPNVCPIDNRKGEKPRWKGLSFCCLSSLRLYNYCVDISIIFPNPFWSVIL